MGNQKDHGKPVDRWIEWNLLVQGLPISKHKEPDLRFHFTFVVGCYLLRRLVAKHQLGNTFSDLYPRAGGVPPTTYCILSPAHVTCMMVLHQFNARSISWLAIPIYVAMKNIAPSFNAKWYSRTQPHCWNCFDQMSGHRNQSIDLSPEIRSMRYE